MVYPKFSDKLLTSISVAREVASPLNEGSALVRARSDREAADSAENAGVAQGWLRGDDGVGDGVLDALFALDQRPPV